MQGRFKQAMVRIGTGLVYRGQGGAQTNTQKKKGYGKEIEWTNNDIICSSNRTSSKGGFIKLILDCKVKA